MTDLKIESDVPIFSISAAAKILNISVHTLRMYEREGLFISYKKDSHNRLFSKDDIERIQCIRRTINEAKISIKGIKAIYSLVPCWKIFMCGSEDRAKCEAFNGYNEPCWHLVHSGTICERQNCRECAVYKEYSDCHKIKELIKSFLNKDI